MTHIYEQRAIRMIWIMLELGQDILVLSTVSKVCNVLFEITWMRDPMSKKEENFINKGQ